MGFPCLYCRKETSLILVCEGFQVSWNFRVDYSLGFHWGYLVFTVWRCGYLRLCFLGVSGILVSKVGRDDARGKGRMGGIEGVFR